jgi:TolA-binding protein
MSVTELHPEEGLDLYEAGALGPREMEALKAHLARCPSCAAHVRWRSDIQASLAEYAGPPTEGWRLAAAALTGQRTPAAEKGEGPPAAKGRQRMMVAAVVIAASLVSAAASATLWPAIERAWQHLSAPARSAQPPRTAPPPRMGAQPPSRPAEPPPQPAAPVPRLTSRATAISPGQQPRQRIQRLATGAPAPIAPAPTAAASLLDALADRPLPQPPASAAWLFAEVARARRAGWLTEAHQAYGELVARFPGSREERAASVLLGQLTLERGELADALTRFERYLGTDPNGALAEEARLGRALAFEQLGQRDDARQAWQELLERHPGSVQAGRARARLESLRSLPRGRQDPPR